MKCGDVRQQIIYMDKIAHGIRNNGWGTVGQRIVLQIEINTIMFVRDRGVREGVGNGNGKIII